MGKHAKGWNTNSEIALEKIDEHWVPNDIEGFVKLLRSERYSTRKAKTVTKEDGKMEMESKPDLNSRFTRVMVRNIEGNLSAVPILRDDKFFPAVCIRLNVETGEVTREAL